MPKETPPYGQLGDHEPLILRDVLAIDRTILANERTLLSYFRTMLALAATGGSLVHFVEASWARLGGAALIAAGGLLFAVGVWRYRRVNADLRSVRREPSGPRP